MTAEQAKRILSDGAYEALDWLRGDTHQASTIGEFGFVESLGSMRRGYAAGAKRIHVYEVYCRMDTGLPFSHRLLVELPAEQPARERIFAWARSLESEPDDDRGQEFLALRLPRPKGESHERKR